VLIIDGDYPMSTGAIDLNRDLTQPLEIVRSQAPNQAARSTHPDSETMASLPEMRRGGVAAALVKVVGRIQRTGSPLWGYRSGEAAYAAAQAHLAYYKILEKRGLTRLLKTSSEFTAHVQAWEQAKDYSQLPVGMVIGMEGADPILWPEQIHDWWEQGLRVVSLSHYGVSTYGHGTGTGVLGGLLPAAYPLLHEMEAAGMILDVTHSSDASVREAMEVFHGAVLASH
jgi:membrane dipeptidase